MSQAKGLIEERAKIRANMAKFAGFKKDRDLSENELDEFERLEEQYNRLSEQIEEIQETEKELARKAPLYYSGESLQADKRVYSPEDKFYNDSKPALVSIGDFMLSMFNGVSNTAQEKYFSRSLQAGSGSGSYTIPTIIGQMIFDKLRNQSVVFKAGAKTIPLKTTTTNFVKVTADNAQAGWVAESPTITAGDQTLSVVSFVPKNYVSLTKVSLQAAHDSVNLSEVLEMQLTNSFREAVESAMLNGTGATNQPKGIYHFTGLACSFNAAGTNMASWAPVCSVLSALESAGVEPTAIIMAPRTYYDLLTLQETTDAYLNPPLGIPPVYRTKAIPVNLTIGGHSDCSYALAGDFRRLYLGIREDVTIVRLNERYMDSMEYGWLGYIRCDVQAVSENSFGKIHAIGAGSALST